MPMQWASIQIRQLHILHNPMTPISIHTACFNSTPNQSAHTSTDKQWRRVPSDVPHKFTFCHHNLWYFQTKFWQTYFKCPSTFYAAHDSSVTTTVTELRPERPRNHGSIPGRDKGLSSLLRKPKVGFGAHRGPLASVVRALYHLSPTFSLRATCFARLILFILSFPLWPKNRCVRCGVIKSSRQVPPATTHLLLERRQLLQYGSHPPAEPACTCTSVSCSHHHCRHKHIPGRSTAIWHPAVSLLDKKFAAFYRTRNVHYRAHKSTPPVPIPCQKNPSMTFLCTPLRPASALSTHLCLVPIIQAFPPKPCTHFSSLPTRATCRAHHIFLDIIVSHPTINHEK